MAYDKPELEHIWAEGGAVVEPSDTKKQLGWVAEVPPHQYENWVQRRQDQFIFHVNERGIPEWDGQTNYLGGGRSLVQGNNGVVYKSVAASGPSGTTQNPITDTSNTYWEQAYPDNDDPRVVNAVPNSRQVNTGDGLSGGGNLSTNRTLSVDSSVVRTSRSITAGTGLSGGGSLAANRTLSVNYGTAAGTAAQGNDSRLSDSREWTADTVSQAEAEAGHSNIRRAWTALRVHQAFQKYGIGGESAVSTANELSGNTPSGIYGKAPGTVAEGFPYGGSWVFLHMSRGARPVQLAVEYLQDRIFLRSWRPSGWSEWKELFHTGSILGEVSQSGGTPTGAIIERGSNSNGEYVKFADGTLIMTRTVTTDPSTGSWQAFELPAFSVEECAASFSLISYTGGNDSLDSIGDAIVQGFSSSIRIAYRGGTSTGEVVMKLLAVGRWF